MWKVPAGASDDLPVPHSRHLFFGGVGLALGNPKTMLFYLAVVPSVVQLGSLTPAGFIALASVIVAVCSAVLVGYVLLASHARRWFTSHSAPRLVNRTCGAAMAGAAALVATRSQCTVAAVGYP